jgi:hypothetical protein
MFNCAVWLKRLSWKILPINQADKLKSTVLLKFLLLPFWLVSSLLNSSYRSAFVIKPVNYCAPPAFVSRAVSSSFGILSFFYGTSLI